MQGSQLNTPLVFSQEALERKDGDITVASSGYRPIKTNTMAKRPFRNQRLLSIMSKNNKRDSEKEREGLLPEEVAFQQMAIEKLKHNIQNQEKV